MNFKKVPFDQMVSKTASRSYTLAVDLSNGQKREGDRSVANTISDEILLNINSINSQPNLCLLLCVKNDVRFILNHISADAVHLVDARVDLFISYRCLEHQEQ